MTTVLSLCSGIGGLELGLLITGVDHRPVWYVESDPTCQDVLRRRMNVLGEAPIHDDLRTFDARGLRGQVDLVTAGFPCQPWSAAGLRRGAADDRHLWPDIFRVVCECAPRMVFLENVQRQAMHEPWADLEALGFSVRCAPFESSEVGAAHRRRRWFLLARYPDTQGELQSERIFIDIRRWASDADWRATEPQVARVVHGISGRLARERRAHERALGNAADPGVVALAWRTLALEAKRDDA